VSSSSSPKSHFLRKITKNEQKQLVGILAGNKSVYLVQGSSFKLLNAKTCLNDEIMNFLINAIDKDSPKEIFMLSTHFYTLLNEGKHKNVKRWTLKKGVDISKLQKILIPINFKLNHWILVEINMEKENIVVYDSLPFNSVVYKDIVENLKSYIVAELKASWQNKNVVKEDTYQKFKNVNEWEVKYPSDIPNQDNDFDCGVFTFLFAKYLSKGWNFDFTQSDIPQIRRQIALDIANYKKEKKK
jgi:Ulp1 family protease